MLILLALNLPVTSKALANQLPQLLGLAVPVADIHHKKQRILLKGELTSPINPKPGCRFAKRCIHAKEECFRKQPELREIYPGPVVACHYVEEINPI